MKTIKNRLYNIAEKGVTTDYDSNEQPYEHYEAALIVNDLEQVVEDIAIQFAEWLQYKDIKPFTDNKGVHFYGLQETYTREEIFEIFKQEKGL